jgi:hypothetical protein
MEYFKGNRTKVDLWMRLKSPLLGDQKPIDMIAQGREEKLLGFIEIEIEENKRD